MTRLPLALVAVLALASGGCGLLGGGGGPVVADTPPDAPAALPPGPTSFTLVGDAEMNAGGNAARVYLYPLVSDATFRATPIQVFWADPEAALGDDLGGPVRDATVRPGSTDTLEEVTLDGAPFLGIAADLRTPNGDAWRAVLPASQVRGKTIRVTVTEGGLVVTSQ